MTITQERIDAIKEDCNQAIAYGRAKKGMDAHATLPANDVLAIIEEVEKLRKQSDWNTNMQEAPRDGTIIFVRERAAFKFTLYGPEQQAKKGKKGRWQKSNGYGGFDNCETPCGDWLLVRGEANDE